MVTKSRKMGYEPYVQVIERFDDEADAFALERTLINEIGRLNTGHGPLYNLTDGGEGPSGVVQSIEARRRRAAGVRAAYSGPEVRKMLSERSLNLWKDPGYRELVLMKWREVWAKPGFYEHRAGSLRRYWADQLNRRKHSRRMREAMTDPSVRERIGKSTRERLKSPEARKLVSERWRAVIAREKPATCPYCGKTGRPGPMGQHIKWHERQGHVCRDMLAATS
jgi:hypothetical protein